MKNLYLIIFLFIGIAASAQAPDKMSYQAVIRDANGALLKSQNVNIQFTVNQTSASGTTVYQEYHTPTTNTNGLVSTYIGTGTVSSGDFSAIDWSNGTYFLQTDIDPTGGTNYVISSTTELVSVPYALYANKAEFADSLIGGVNFVDLTTNQTVDGEKTFNNDLTVNGITVGRGRGAMSSNTANGGSALYSNTTGYHNTANGSSALQSNTTGNDNTANGFQALYSNTTGNDNTANGFQALYFNTTGSNNTANGSYALISNTTGGYNTANGSSALQSNTTGFRNTANGSSALQSNTTGSNNTANGFQALYFNTTGSNNTANGSYALISNTTGYDNTANGVGALISNTTGGYNTANGRAALSSNTTGGYNTANGRAALSSNTTGFRNTALGYSANVSSNNLSNATAIGNGAIVSASDRVRIGNSSVSRIEGQVAWTSVSDGRIKENVQEAVPGLSFISQLRPVTYTLNTRKQDDITMQAMPDSIKERRMLSDADYLESSSIVRTGFIAQEVEAAAKKVGFDFDGVSTPENETDLYGIRYAEFVVPLVKAMQEQQEMIDGQKGMIDGQQEVMQEQQEMIDGQQATIEQQKSDYLLLLKRIEALEKE
jgi:trimeric autotransporter adhesin